MISNDLDLTEVLQLSIRTALCSVWRSGSTCGTGTGTGFALCEDRDVAPVFDACRRGAEWEECAVYCCERGIPSAGQGGLERSKGVSIMQQAVHLAEEMGEKLARRSDMQREMSKTSEA